MCHNPSDSVDLHVWALRPGSDSARMVCPIQRRLKERLNSWSVIETLLVSDWLKLLTHQSFTWRVEEHLL